MKPILVTGVAGFIGFHVARTLLKRGRPVFGIDNINDYYDPSLKRARLALLQEEDGFAFLEIDVADRVSMEGLFQRLQPEFVIHLAAQAGVRYSVENPYAYVDSNLVGFINVLEGCRHHGTRHLTYASSSSVYGANTSMPFSVHDNVDHPLSLYAASKKANELMAHSYSHLYGLPTTGLRFFTVYGPWGRPDMAIFLFTKAILEGRPIDVFNHGEMKRDFTFIDDIVEGVIRTSDTIATPNPSWNGAMPDAGSSKAPYRLYNIGNNQPIDLMRVIALLEAELGRESRKNFLPMQAGDVPETYADIGGLVAAVGFHPQTSIEEGICRFVSWYRAYYRI